MRDFGRFEDFSQLRQFLTSALFKHLSTTNEKSKSAQKYRFEHCLRVAKIGRAVALANSATAQPIDPDLLELGCLLHDIGKWDAVEAVDHGRAGALLAYRLLRDAGLDQPICQELAQGIAMHVDNHWNPRSHGGTFENRAGEKYFLFDSEPTLLARLIGQCDDLDRFSTYRIFDTLHYFKFLEMRTAQQIAWINGYLLQLAAEQPSSSKSGSMG